MPDINFEIKQKLITGLSMLGFNPTPVQIEKLMTYLQLLEKWNKVQDLTAVKNREDMVSRHVLDSLSIGPYLQGVNIADVGSGAGLPGIPLSIMYPERHFSLIESMEKRVLFLAHVISELSLSYTQVIHQRVNLFKPVQFFDTVVSRAFASLSDMLRWTAHLGSKKTNTQWLAMKGPKLEEEVLLLPENFILEQTISLSVPFEKAERYLVVVKIK
jgi:16S rRNA (guanine(527)-N(7))-methyltransferase RsmG